MGVMGLESSHPALGGQVHFLVAHLSYTYDHILSPGLFGGLNFHILCPQDSFEHRRSLHSTQTETALLPLDQAELSHCIEVLIHNSSP